MVDCIVLAVIYLPVSHTSLTSLHTQVTSAAEAAAAHRCLCAVTSSACLTHGHARLLRNRRTASSPLLLRLMPLKKKRPSMDGSRPSLDEASAFSACMQDEVGDLIRAYRAVHGPQNKPTAPTTRQGAWLSHACACIVSRHAPGMQILQQTQCTCLPASACLQVLTACSRIAV